MSEEEKLLGIAQAALGTFDHRQSYAPGMFEPLKPLFRSLGYESAAVYIADDYPDRMHLESSYGGEDWFPTYVALDGGESLHQVLTKRLAQVPGVMTARLFSHDRELGVLAVTAPNAKSAEARKSFDILAQSMSIMAYIERVRTNGKRERQERDVFFAQSLTSRLLVRDTPKVKGLRVGVESIRSLEAGGDFYDFVATRDGRLVGFFGCCNGKGLRTVLEVCCIMRETHRSFHASDSPAETLRRVNRLLVKEKKRAHQASLCFFEIDPAKRTLRLAKAGRLGMLLCGPGERVENISVAGGLFLGMSSNPKVHDEAFPFKPGQALFGVTEGFYTSRNCLGAKPQFHWFLSAVQDTLAAKRRKPLANAVFENLDNAVDYATRPMDSMLALSVEATGK